MKALENCSACIKAKYTISHMATAKYSKTCLVMVQFFKLIRKQLFRVKCGKTAAEIVATQRRLDKQ